MNETDMPGDAEDDPRVVAAFDRLRGDSQQLDTRQPLQRIRNGGQRRPWVVGLIGASITIGLMIIVGIGVGLTSDNGPDQVTTGPEPADQDGSDDGPQPGPGIAGTSWLLLEGVGADGEVPLVPGWPITLTFESDRLGGTAACNGYGGTYTVDGNSLNINELSYTEMGCEPAVMVSEAAYLSVLGQVTELRLDDNWLVLSGPGGQLVFGRDSAAPIAEVMDRVWALETWGISTDSSGVPAVGPGWLRLGSDGSVEGNTGCRALEGNYIVAGASIVFTDFGASGNCAPSLRDQDNAVVTVLGDGFVAEASGGSLVTRSQGDEALSFTEAEEPPSDPVADSVPIESLIGRVWVLQEGIGPRGEIVPSDDGATIDIVFDPATATFGSDCQRATVAFSLDQGAIVWENTDMEEEDCDNGFREAVLAASRVELFGNGEDAQLVLSGPDVDLLFQAGGDQPTEPTQPSLTVEEVLENRPTGFVPVTGHVVETPGGWILCGGPLAPGPFPCLGNRWLTLVDYEPAWWGGSEDNPLTMVGSADPHDRWIVSPTSPASDSVPPMEAPGFVITEPELDLLDSIVGAATDGGAVDTSSFAPEVSLALGGEIELVRTADELSDPTAWVIDREEFQGYGGPFSVLEVIRSRLGLSSVQVGIDAFVGPHDHCAAPPTALPDAGFDRQLVIEPTGIDSCLQWFVVDVLVDETGQVVAINLDLWEP
ncbi:MAG: META domain-containing protein [Acidimicrobiales bacterium]